MRTVTTVIVTLLLVVCAPFVAPRGQAQKGQAEGDPIR